MEKIKHVVPPNHRVINGEEEQMFNDYVYLVGPVVSRVVDNLPKFAKRDSDVFYNVGLIGLWKAVQKFEPKYRGFVTYARTRIYGEIVDELRLLDVLTRDQRRKVQNGEPNPISIISLSQVVVECDDDSLENVIPDGMAVTPFEHLCLVEESGLATRVFLGLPEVMRTVINLYYFQDLGLKEIGERLQLTESRICQIKQEAIRTLRMRMPK